MNELIKLTQQTLDNEQVNTVNARELHEFLGSRQDFSTWIKARLVKARAKENKDFCTAPQTYGTVNGGHSSKLEYFLSFEIAKHIALMENTDKGSKYEIISLSVKSSYNKPYLLRILCC